MDEVLTVWRCGAPYAHLLPEYKSHISSFVVFGKAVSASGIAVHWDGIHVRRLGYADPQFAGDKLGFVHEWDHKSSRNINPNDALRSWGYILLSDKDRWCETALQIGENLRKWLQKNCPTVEVGGRGAFIYLPAEDVGNIDIVGAAVNGLYVRRLPYLDEALKDDKNVDQLFNKSGIGARHRVAAQNLSALRCISCGDFLHTMAYGPCPVCYGRLCQEFLSAGKQSRHLKKKCLSATGG